MQFAPALSAAAAGRPAAARRIHRLVASPAGVDATVPLGIIVAGGVLAWLCRDYPAAMPVWAPWDFSWLEFLAVALGVWWYARGVTLSPAEERPSMARRLSFAAGVTLIYAVLQTHYDYMAQHMFFLNRLQHLAMHHLGPFLIALAWPDAAILRGMPAPLRRLVDGPRLYRVMHIVQQPVIAVFLPALYVTWFRVKRPNAVASQSMDFAHIATATLSD